MKKIINKSNKKLVFPKFDLAIEPGEIKEITDKNTWEGFWASREEKTFLQSWNWGEFWQKMGNSYVHC